jgi:hypothetical protein
MGGMCDHPFTDDTKDGIMTQAMRHLEEKHPQMAADVKAMPKDDPMMVKWSADFEKTWEAAPTV